MPVTFTNALATFGQISVLFNALSSFGVALLSLYIGSLILTNPSVVTVPATVVAVDGARVSVQCEDAATGFFTRISGVTYAPGQRITVQRDAGGALLEDVAWGRMGYVLLAFGALLLTLGYYAIHIVADRKNVAVVMGAVTALDLIF